MLSLYEILKASKTGIATDMWTALAGMNWGGAGSGAETKEITGIPPLSIRSNGTMLLDYLISGNMSQASGVSPTTPIQPQECGERTENLFDYSTIVPGYTYDDTNGQMILNPDGAIRWRFAAVPLIEVESGATYLRTYNLSPWGNYINFYDSNKNFLEQVSPGSGVPVTVPSNCNFVSFVFQIGDFDVEKYMFTKGSTAPTHFEPYGYKIPISSGGNNLWDEDYTGIGTSITYLALNVGDGEFTMSTTAPSVSAGAPLFLLSGNVSSGASTATNGVTRQISRTVSSTGGYITVAYRNVNGSYPEDYDTMLNRGSTAIPYEPYVQPTLSNIYLGEVQTTRRIGKLVLDGTENWRQSVNGAMYLSPFTGESYKKEVAITSMNSHFAVQINTKSGTNQVEDNSSCFLAASGSTEYYIGARSYATAADFKTYLAQQYANGTPVTVWYVLAEPETSIVNEPLRKIGDYADTVSYEQAGVQIPTNRGNTVIDVETELKPSEMYIKYKG